ncbi:trk system potassium uptake protein TrkA [Hydrogenispora ethanolica]|jgi:trk system potassium uptake protein TrkA|uniref:Trk system potassium uptake protein TrkA n=1 Tax=Hydrogenispora ethanolica TaxID=1082276 RepID=A0A4R1RXU3_HYDET|nr:NAD-binding protein [Hydrogenispora ethanolica]TCL71561.1 trk system potassium uptake protein TrkA [Hydrogenispora ethanolica]
MNVVVIGCGRFGGYLIRALSKSPDPPYIIAVDRQERALAELATEFRGFTLIKDASDLSVLDEARLSRADALFLSTGDANLNFMLAHIAQELYKVPRVVVVESDAERREVLDCFAIATVDPMELAARQTVDRLSAEWGLKS